MQPAQLEQLKKLITTSPLLQEAERAHWLELLPLMNDKQLGELDQILRPRPAQAPVLSHLANLPNKVMDRPVQPPRPVFQPPRVVPPAPPLAPPPLRPVAQPPRPVPQPRPAVDITEKELPSGRMASSDHLLAAQKPVAPAPQAAPPGPPPARTVPPPTRPPLPRADTFQLPERKSTFAHIMSQPEHSSVTFSPPPVAPPPKVAATTIVPPRAAPARNIPPPAQVTGLPDLSRIGLETFHALGPSAMAAKLREFVKQAGYIEVVFALEQSPLFADYVATGQTLLEQNASFDRAGAVQTRDGETLLDKNDFEAMTDLLRQIQINP